MRVVDKSTVKSAFGDIQYCTLVVNVEWSELQAMAGEDVEYLLTPAPIHNSQIFARWTSHTETVTYSPFGPVVSTKTLTLI